MATISKRGTVGNGASPRIEPRPAYPSFAEIATKFAVLYLFQMCVVGSYLIHLLGPVYAWSRNIALTYHVSDAQYFAIVLSSLHIAVFLVVNARKFSPPEKHVFIVCIKKQRVVISNHLLQTFFVLKQHTLSVMYSKSANLPNSIENPT